METRVIVNPSAGAARAASRALALRSRLEEALGPLEWRESRSASHVEDLAREAALAGHARVIVAGGDGTVHFAANALAGSETALGILPVGTGNDIAFAAGVPKEIEGATHVLAAGHVRRLDVALARERIACCVLGVGMDTEALGRINSARFLRRGHLLYTCAALRTLLTYRPQRMKITWDDGSFDGEVVFAAITNTRSYAGGMKITPDSRVDDGKLDLCVIPRMSLPRTLASFGRVVRGAHAGMRGIVLAQSRRVSIETDRPLPVTFDGELTDLTTPLDAGVLPGALRVIGSPVASLERDTVHEREGELIA
ncbi:diacylglycerol kinase family lipid kinase [bacterium]|nr:diacylglycerol kinase family lipid kinase [bacterium]